MSEAQLDAARQEGVASVTLADLTFLGPFRFITPPAWFLRFIIQFTWLHRVLWELLTLGGLLNEHSLRPLLRWLIRRGHAGTAMELLRLPLNRIGVRALFREASAAGIPCPLL